MAPIVATQLYPAPLIMPAIGGVLCDVLTLRSRSYARRGSCQKSVRPERSVHSAQMTKTPIAIAMSAQTGW